MALEDDCCKKKKNTGLPPKTEGPPHAPCLEPVRPDGPAEDAII